MSNFSYVPKGKRSAKPTLVSDIRKSGNKKDEDNLIPEYFLKRVQYMANFQTNLKNYITRCFKECHSEQERNRVSHRLCDKIYSVSQTGNVNNYNWLMEPLVQTEELAIGQHDLPTPAPVDGHQVFSSAFIPNANPELQEVLPTNTESVSYDVKHSRIDFPSVARQHLSAHPSKVSNARDFPNDKIVYPSTGYFASLKVPDPVDIQKFAPKSSPIGLNRNAYLTSNPKKYTNYNNPTYIPPPLKAEEKRKEDQEKDQTNKPKEIKETNETNQEEFIDQNQNLEYKGKKNTQTIKTPGQIFQEQIARSLIPNEYSYSDEENFENQEEENNENKENKENDENESEQKFFEFDINRIRKIEGKGEELEKRFKVLTQIPNEKEIRSEEVLRKAFSFVLEKYEKTKDYLYIKEQLNTIKQELLIQKIENDFLIKILEISAKIAIENGDWKTFNQDQIMLLDLYKKGYGELNEIANTFGNRILYLIGTNQFSELDSFIRDIFSPESEENEEKEKEKNSIIDNEEIQFALTVWKIITTENWIKFLEIMKQEKEKNTEKNQRRWKLLNINVQQIRIQALETIMNGFKQPNLKDFQELLAFDSLSETSSFLHSQKIPVSSK